jgi:hypothetical protein
MKASIFKQNKLALVTGVLCALTSSLSANAASSFITFSIDMSKMIDAQTFVPGTDQVEVHGSFNGWGAVTLVQSNSSTIYTNTVEDTSDANGGVVFYKYVINGSNWESLPTGNNRAARLPSASGGKIAPSTCYFNDNADEFVTRITFQVDLSQQINLGNFHPGTDYVVVRGTFNHWSGDFTLDNDPTILTTNQYGLVSSNVYVTTLDVGAASGAMQEYKFVLNGSSWESPASGNSISGNQGGNRFFCNVDQTLPVVDFSDSPYAPVAGLTFSVDMSIIVLQDTGFDPTSVTINGSFNGWSSGIAMTNNPNASNPNIYTTSTIISNGVGATMEYQFRYTSSGSTVYDHFNGVNGGSGNRIYTVPNGTLVNVPAVYFNDAKISDYLTKDMTVTFLVDMTGAVGTDSHVFNPATDDVYINGAFLNWYTWTTPTEVNPADPGYLFTPIGNNIYSCTVTIPAGKPVAFEYKYGIDEGRLGGPIDNESGSKTNHFRVIRSMATGTYAMPQDTFGTMYKEPYFNDSDLSGGDLKITPIANGQVTVSWLGRPGACLQYCTSLTTHDWTTLSTTDGTTWTSGYKSGDGFVSQTNWPATSQTTFFRLIKK